MTPKPANGAGALTPREWQVLRRVAKGMTGKAIASQLGVSPETIKTLNARIRRKLNQRRSCQLAGWLATYDHNRAAVAATL